jgi:ribonuclease BN (tRNA processing enzyme)
LRLTVLGKSPSWQDAGGACSGYLIEEQGTTLLLDCGNGVFGKLREHRDYVDVDAVVISHLHADHILDLVTFAYGLTYAPRQQPVPVHGWPGTNSPARPRLIAPAGATTLFRKLCGLWGNEDLIVNAFVVEEYDANDTFTVGDLQIRFCGVPHYIETFAVEVRSSLTGARIVYSSDTAPSDRLVEFATGADLLLIEATLPRAEREGPRGHLTPAEAGEHAKRAGVARVVLTHISDELDCDWAKQEATGVFGGMVTVATGGAVYDVPGS